MRCGEDGTAEIQQGGRCSGGKLSADSDELTVVTNGECRRFLGRVDACSRTADGREAQFVGERARRGEFVGRNCARSATSVSYAFLTIVKVQVNRSFRSILREGQFPVVECGVEFCVFPVERREGGFSFRFDFEALSGGRVGEAHFAQILTVTHRLRAEIIFIHVIDGGGVASEETARAAVHVVCPRSAGIVTDVRERARDLHGKTEAAQFSLLRRVGCRQVHVSVGINLVGEDIVAQCSRALHRGSHFEVVRGGREVRRGGSDAVRSGVVRVVAVGRVVFNPSIVVIVRSSVRFDEVNALQHP